uniref:Uncharacterized protein n=1 Tax=Pyramimonas obovata TaxID=1411642 RepID=A0A7S0QW02_9CHLO|mmetsp:Transcript_13521/g.28776  ORF Transcript_13521/g.28776 Transcript_13521/m.28776 type:complete len:135 (+) Transcript_13521:75-479(+)|eukprot:CAMPEP_0118930338 /NCGR_PEP_ID=MMETSP1169-20130426/7060_1 /TAXON_ID=36882 /ORGANISM="Pyramimonas obovata, Strain CCMP722" /LENGTH=134 /DNA_ID=CAMNT_0006872677 /DNA_START=65 /DNA_END=469 /DNA_ORIENTATION=+
MAFCVAVAQPTFVLRSNVNKSAPLRSHTLKGVRRTANARSRVVLVRAEEKKDTLSALDAMLETEKPAEEEKPAELFDDGKEPPKPQMSEAQRRKLRDEYLALGGSPNKPIPNYFLYIILVISALAVSAALTGAI